MVINIITALFRQKTFNWLILRSVFRMATSNHFSLLMGAFNGKSGLINTPEK
jgi:hypothetical protein